MVEIDKKTYPALAEYTRAITKPNRPILGREYQIQKLKSTFPRPELSNAILLAHAGVGKTAIVEQLASEDESRLYLQVNLPSMSQVTIEGMDGATQMATRMNNLIEEVIEFQKDSNRELILFIDEFHLLPQLSNVAAQSIKQVLAESGRINVKIIAATTSEEFDEYIRGDAAFEQRLQPIRVPEPSDEVVVSILKSMCDTFLPSKVRVPNALLLEIVRTTNLYLPSDAQPRKSIRVLDSMIGWYKANGGRFNHQLLVDMFKDQTNFDIDWDVDIEKLHRYLDKRVIDQAAASATLCRYLYISVAGLSDASRPQGSFLFTGSTGVGKTEMVKAFTSALFGSEDHMIRFDMSEYSNPELVDTLQQRLTTKVWENPFTVILFDEIEKSSLQAIQLLLQVLDDARLTDRYGRQISFQNCYIIMTTNEAQDVFRKVAANVETDARGINEYQEVIKDSLIRDTSLFTPEFINRLDAFVPFKPLSRRALVDIAKMQLWSISDLVFKKYNTLLHFHNRIVPYLTSERMGVDTDAGGGRAIHRLIYSEVLASVAEKVRKYPDESDLVVYVDGEMALENKQKAFSDAEIKVTLYDNQSRKLGGVD